MSKELIERLREDGKFLSGNFGKLMQEAADALEAKAAPVGEREAFEAAHKKLHPQVKIRVQNLVGAYTDKYVDHAAFWFSEGAAYQRQSGVVMPEGYALVPQRMYLSEEAIESITVHCGDGQDDAGYGPYQGGVLWIGEIEEEDGTKTYGLHIATADYPEDGSTTLVEFARLNGKEVV